MTTPLRRRLALAMFWCGFAFATPGVHAEPGSGYRLESQTVLPSGDTGWDYLALDDARHRLFIARRADGLTVWDTRERRVIRTLDDSTGANGPLLLPRHDRGFCVNTDGSVTVFELGSLHTLARRAIDAGDLNAAFYEPTTDRVIVVTGSRPRASAFIVLDPRSGEVLARHEIDSRKVDTPAVDGQGALFVPLRDRHQMLKMSARDFHVEQVWPLGDCSSPVAAEYDAHRQRVLLGCRGDQPVLLVLDARDGRPWATLPIGQGIDGLVHDAERGWVITANGASASLSVIRETADGGYMPVETISTRPMARTMAFEPSTRRLFLVTADHTVAAPAGAAHFHPDTFTVLSYAPR